MGDKKSRAKMSYQRALKKGRAENAIDKPAPKMFRQNKTLAGAKRKGV